ncbi:hypothetical protein HHL22_20520 [Hymenobacter sp. RP-2-7]|uniref:Fibronectin type-III domain-containing protein n=1 Tax=Hymenobacter polaris TaxID=2682546 RepID=A0A7Y0AI28_9BACT|nr:hypothetical protein [Hymenobacter polaris]NML67592.1 hypothetical protein [Hymenobacter polaris]
MLALLLLAGHLALGQDYTYVAGQNLGLFEGRQLRAGESLLIPKGVTAYCTFQVVGPGVRIVNEGTWHPSQGALEYGAQLLNAGTLEATFLQINEGLFVNQGQATFQDVPVAAKGRLTNTTTGTLVVTNLLQVAGQLQNCGQLQARNFGYYYDGVEIPCTQVPLPVTLLAFTARAVGHGVLLEWRVASELNAARYEVERSADGRQFAPIGQVTARGATAYSYPDQASPAAVYYRLRSVDTDGQAAYSPVVALAGPALVRRSYYNQLGQRLAGPGPGFYVEVAEYDNAAIERKKYVGQ